MPLHTSPFDAPFSMSNAIVSRFADLAAAWTGVSPLGDGLNVNVKRQTSELAFLFCAVVLAPYAINMRMAGK